MKLAICAVLLPVFLMACDSEPPLSDDLLDGSVLFDPSIADPASFLLSYSNPTPSSTDAAKPVFIAVHGYSGTTFEWDEFRDWSGNRTDYFLSQVLLGGHGRTYADFKAATWQDWQSSVVEEYDRLVSAGYSNINFVASSTGATILLEMLGSGFFEGRVAPKNFLFVDPIIVPSDKLLSLIHILGPSIGYVEADNKTEEDRYWYHYRPQETLQELLSITQRVRKQLEDGMVLPSGSRLKVYKSVKDPTADPVSAVLIYKGVRDSGGGPIAVEMVESTLHVFTRLSLRADVTSADVTNQDQAFEDFVSRATQ